MKKILFGALVVLLTSCSLSGYAFSSYDESKTDTPAKALKYSLKEGNIDFPFFWKKSRFKGYKQSESGLYYKLHKTSKDTTLLKIGDLCYASMKYRTFNDSVFNQNPAGQPFGIELVEPLYKGDIFDGLSMLHPGDSVTFIMKTDTFFEVAVGIAVPAFMDSAEYFYIDFRIDSIVKKEELERRQQKQHEIVIEKENQLIADFVKENNITQLPGENGMYVLIDETGKGEQVENGKYVSIHYKITLLGRGLLADTHDDTRGGGEPIDYLVGSGQMGTGFDQAIAQMYVGTKARVLIPSSLAFGEKGIERIIPPYSALFLEMEVMDMFDHQELEARQKAMQEKQMELARERKSMQQKEIKAYLEQEGINAEMDENGIFIHKIKQGTGAMPQAGQTVEVHYTGTFLDGSVFDSSVSRGQPFSFSVGVGNVISGWDLTVAKMREGDKWKVVIPSNLAYGEQERGTIAANSILVFEIELIKVEQ